MGADEQWGNALRLTTSLLLEVFAAIQNNLCFVVKFPALCPVTNCHLWFLQLCWIPTAKVVATALYGL